MFGSVLYGSNDGFETHWYCSSKFDDSWLWLADYYAILPITNCLANYLSCTVNETTGAPISHPGLNIYTIDFGGDGAIRYLDPGILGYHILPILYNALDRFIDAGYQLRTDLFGAPYDWRLNPMNLGPYWNDLKGLIETAYNQNDNTGVALFGFSAGNYVIQQFLTKYVDPEWKAKYVDRAIMLGPSFAGSIEPLLVLLYGRVYFIPVIDSDDIDMMCYTLPTLYAHLPNSQIWGSRAIIQGPDGTNYNAHELFELLKTQKKVPEKYIPIYQTGLPYIDGDVLDPEIDIYFLFNAAMETPEFIKYEKGWDKDFTIINGLGDTTISKHGLYFGCDNWKSDHVRVCHDINTTESGYEHAKMVTQEDVIELIYQAATSDDWKKSNKVAKRTHYITGHGSAGWKNLKAE